MFLEPGLGKTLISISVMDLLHAIHPHDRFLVVAPNLVARTSWPDELEHWKDLHRLDWTVACGTAKQRTAALEERATITIINQENIQWLDRQIKDWPWEWLIVDELGGYRNPNSQRFRVLRRRRRRMKGCLGLTGTPAVRTLLDLWAEMMIVDQGASLGTRLTRYREEYFTPDRWVNGRPVTWREKPGAATMILNRLETVCLSMSAKDHLPGLPSMIQPDIHVDMPAPTRRTYDRIRENMVLDLPEGRQITAVNAGVLTAKLTQLTCGCLYPDMDDSDRSVEHLDDAKLDRLDDLIGQADGPMLVFYQLTDELDRMRQHIPDLREIHEPDIVDDWNHGRVRVLAAQPAAAKYGLNLQHGGSEITWTSLPWSFDDYRQACDRLHRQGQSDTVRVNRLIEPDTVDIRKNHVLAGRENLHEAVMRALGE